MIWLMVLWVLTGFFLLALWFLDWVLEINAGWPQEPLPVETELEVLMAEVTDNEWKLDMTSEEIAEAPTDEFILPKLEVAL